MSRKSTFLASSLSVCAATASWAILSSAEEPTIHVEMIDHKPDQLQKDAQGAVYKYLNPVAINWQGEASVESKSLAYRIQKDDTLSKVARLYKQNFREIASVNKIVNPDRISVGRDLKIEVKTKLVSVPSGGLTVETFAEKNQMDLEVLFQLNPTIERGAMLEEGKLLYVLVDQSKVRTVVSPSVTRSSSQNRKANSGNVVQFQKGSIRVAPQKSYVFSWPVRGTITSQFGWRNGRQHQGMDIWNSARSNAPIKASLQGVVIKASYFNNGYGNLVVIDHGGGWVTYYAHLSSIKVKVGQKVNTGDLVGYMGSTGNSTGYHLHFEIRKDGKPYNPANYLK